MRRGSRLLLYKYPLIRRKREESFGPGFLRSFPFFISSLVNRLVRLWASSGAGAAAFARVAIRFNNIMRWNTRGVCAHICRQESLSVFDLRVVIIFLTFEIRF